MTVKKKKPVQILLQNTPIDESKLQTFLKNLGKQYGISKFTISEIDLALGELLLNIINYGSTQDQTVTIDMNCKIDKNKIIFTIIDNGLAFNPLEYKTHALNPDIKARPIGGLGILVAKKSMDSISYERKDNQNILKLVKTFKS